MSTKSNRGTRRQGGQTALSVVDETGAPEPRDTPIPGTRRRRPRLRVERAVDESIKAARTAGADPRMAAAEALARELAAGIDVAALKMDPYALAQLGPKLLDVLKELGMTRPPEQTDSALSALLADLRDPD